MKVPSKSVHMFQRLARRNRQTNVMLVDVPSKHTYAFSKKECFNITKSIDTPILFICSLIKYQAQYMNVLDI